MTAKSPHVPPVSPESLSTVRGVTTHPACGHTAVLLLFLKPTTALVGKAVGLRLFISSLFQGHAGSFCPQGGWYIYQALIFMLNVFSFVSQFWFYGSENSFILQFGAQSSHAAASEEFKNLIKLLCTDHHQSSVLFRSVINAVNIHQA